MAEQESQQQEPDNKQYQQQQHQYHLGEQLAETTRGVEVLCKNLARIFQIEELAISAMEDTVDEDGIVAAIEPEDILALRKESRQLLKVIRLTSFYMFILTVVYLCQSLFCLEQLDPRDFEASLGNQNGHAEEIYSYSVEFERMKVVHAITLGSIAGFVTLFTCRYRTLNQLHYLQLLIVSLVVSLLYFLPLVYIAWLSYGTQQVEDSSGLEESHSRRADWELALIRFAEWFFMLLERSDLGVFGLVVSTLVHLQIYGLLLVMQWCAWHMRTIELKISVMQDASQGTYQGVEMQTAAPDIEMTFERQDQQQTQTRL